MILADMSFARTEIVLSWLPITCEPQRMMTHYREGGDTTFTIGRLELVISRYMAPDTGISVTWTNDGDSNNDDAGPPKPRSRDRTFPRP